MIYGFGNFLALFSYKYLKKKNFFEKPINIMRDKTLADSTLRKKKLKNYPPHPNKKFQ